MLSGLATDLQRMATLHFLVLTTIVGGATLYLFYLIWKNFHRARIIEDTPTARVRSAPQGYVELEGSARSLPEQEVVAPLTNSACVWFRFKVEQERRGGSSGGSNWSLVESGSSSEPFIFYDDTGQCLVDPRGSEVLPGVRKVWYGSSRWPGGAEKRGLFGLLVGKRYRYTEERIDAGGIYILGWFDTRRGTSNSLEEDVSALLRSWKQNQKLLKQRFDYNRDGVLDDTEWHQARLTARHQVSRERAERAAEPEINWVGASEHDHQPFLISARAQLLMPGRFRRNALLSLLGTLAGIAALTWMLLARLLP